MPPVFSCMGLGPVTAERILLTGIVTLGSGIQLMFFARRVHFAREQHGIEHPAMTGNPDFERVVRAQQNILEWHPVFMSALWTSALFFNQVPSAICGLLYLISRHRYFNGYSRSVEERGPGFRMGLHMLRAMGVMAVIGIGRTIFVAFGRHHGGWQGGAPQFWRGGQ
ncbi:hypothetical protein ACOMHN_067279 [Nucella lapillus]